MGAGRYKDWSDEPLTEQERRKVGRLLSDPLSLPDAFRGWLENTIEEMMLNGSEIPVGVSGGSYSAAVLADGPALYWKMDDPFVASPATNFLDYSGHGRDSNSDYSTTTAFQQDGPPIAPAPSYSFQQTGGGTGIGLEAMDAGLQATDNFTCEIWVYPLAFGIGLPPFIVQCGASTGWNLTTTLGGANDHFAFGKSGFDVSIIADSAFSLNTWYHVVVVNRSGTTVMYINGVAQSLTANVIYTVPSGSVRIGPATNVNQDMRLDGKFAHLAIYQTALSAARIAAHYEARL